MCRPPLYLVKWMIEVWHDSFVQGLLFCPKYASCHAGQSKASEKVLREILSLMLFPRLYKYPIWHIYEGDIFVSFLKVQMKVF